MQGNAVRQLAAQEFLNALDASLPSNALSLPRSSPRYQPTTVEIGNPPVANNCSCIFGRQYPNCHNFTTSFLQPMDAVEFCVCGTFVSNFRKRSLSNRYCRDVPTGHVTSSEPRRHDRFLLSRSFPRLKCFCITHCIRGLQGLCAVAVLFRDFCFNSACKACNGVAVRPG